MRTSIIALLSNVVLNLILMVPFKEAGLALATSISGIIQFGQLIYFYPKKVGEFPLREIAASFLRILLASIVMGVVGHYSLRFLGHWIPGQGTKVQLLQVFGSIAFATVFYLGLCLACRVPEAKEAWEWFANKKKRYAVNPIDTENLMDGT
jgi:putative peptidoglycan lipid II flippase